jgi:hypothetical protein
MWFFTEGAYIRHDQKGAIKGRITGQNIPNPNETWKARCEAFGATYPMDAISHPTTGEHIRLKPTEAAFKIFEHWENARAHLDN